MSESRRLDHARLYVNEAEQPVLVVNDLKQPTVKGSVALWIGTGTIAHFADLKTTPLLME